MRSYKFKLIYFLFALLCAGTIFSCAKNSESDKVDRTVSVKLNVERERIVEGGELELTAVFTPAVVDPSKGYKWQVANANIATVAVNADFSAMVVGKRAGTTEVVLVSMAGKKMASCIVTVVAGTVEEPQDDGITKILAIGNSFSEDALENHFYGLANAKGHKVIIGNLYIGGASLTLHLQNATNNATAYSYRKINRQGVKATTANTSIQTALWDEDWDYISFQQESPNSGVFSTFTPLVALYDYVAARATNPQVRYVLHQTWAYANNSTHSGFANYGKDQDVMYAAIVDAYSKAKNLIPADRIVPTGTAIQNGRTSIIGDNFCRDGYHLDVNIGRYTASCAWFEAIFGESVIGNSYKPAALGAYETEIAQHAAHFATLDPNKVTEMVDYQGSGGVSDFTEPILINFGGTSTPYDWNGLTQFTANTTIPNLHDKVGKNTNIALTIVEPFNGRNLNGPTTTTTAMNIPGSVSSDSYYGNPEAAWEGKLVERSVVRLSGMNKDKKFKLCFFGARAGAGNENRETKYTVTGANEVITYLDAANNTSNIACADQVQPNANGEITITLTAGDNNNNQYGFYYINALSLTQVN